LILPLVFDKSSMYRLQPAGAYGDRIIRAARRRDFPKTRGNHHYECEAALYSKASKIEHDVTRVG
jgi:hypothetical protein